MKIRDAARRHLLAARDMLAEIITYPSVRGEERELVGKMREIFAGVGDSCVAVPIPESIVDDPLYSFPLENLSYEGRDNIVSVLEGTGERGALVFNTHMDVVPPSSGHEDPFKPRVSDGLLYGRGACDAKGQVAALYLAFLVLEELGLKPKGDVIAHLVVEEECGGNGTLALVRDGFKADGVVVLEPTGLKILPSVRGAIWFVATCHGCAGHSGDPKGVVSALKKAVDTMGIFERYHARLLAESKGIALFDEFDNPMPLCIGQLNSGDWPSIAPEKAVIRGLIGFLPNRTWQEVRNGLLDAVQREGDEWLREHFDLDLIYRHDCSVTDPEHPLVKALESGCGAAGIDARIAAMPASCDACYYRNEGNTPTVVFGPGRLLEAHTDMEHVELVQIEQAAVVLAHLMVE